jgi:hypothetical protein
MRRLPTAPLRSVIWTVTTGALLSLGVTGCDSGDGGNPIEQAKTGQEAAKSSMEYMKQRHAAQKPGPRAPSKAPAPGR